MGSPVQGRFRLTHANRMGLWVANATSAHRRSYRHPASRSTACRMGVLEKEMTVQVRVSPRRRLGTFRLGETVAHNIPSGFWSVWQPDISLLPTGFADVWNGEDGTYRACDRIFFAYKRQWRGRRLGPCERCPSERLVAGRLNCRSPRRLAERECMDRHRGDPSRALGEPSRSISA